MTASIRLKPLLMSIAITQIGGWLSTLGSADMKGLYASLNLPDFAPPGWVFGVVWPLLYLMLGIAAYVIWEKPRSSARVQALTFYGVQLLLNFLWSPLFFGMEQFSAAFWLLCALLVMATITTLCFAFLDRRTLWTMLPYLVWLLYAAALNRAVAQLN